MSNEYKVTTPVVEELKEIDANLNELEAELDSLMTTRDKKLAAKGKYTLDSFKANKSVNKDIEDLEKVIALAYQERKEIADSVSSKYIQGLKKETSEKNTALLNEGKKLFEGKTFSEVAAAMSTDFHRLLVTHDGLCQSHNFAMGKLVEVLGGDPRSNKSHNLDAALYGGVHSYLYSVKRAVNSWLDEELRVSGRLDHDFRIDS